MGLLETLDGLELADDVKARIRQEHEQELGGNAAEVANLRAQARRTEVEQEVETLKGLGFSESPGLLKFVRRVLLSDDQEGGLVLLSDADMNLSGDDATGAGSKEEISVAGAVRKFIELLPKNDEGKLALSDQVLADNDTDKPNVEDDDEQSDTEGAKKRLSKITGNTATRTRSRYSGGRPVPAGGDS